MYGQYVGYMAKKPSAQFHEILNKNLGFEID